MPADPGASTPSDGTICVLWTAPPPQTAHRTPHQAPDPPAQPPQQLSDLLAQRGFAVQIATGPHLAMARACRAAASNARTILILDRPQRLPRAQELIQALQAYAPGVLVWAYDPANRPNLAALAPETAPNQTDPTPVQRSRAAPAPLRLVGNGPAAAEPDNQQLPTPHSVLSPEELEMLLAEEER
ncbi:MAG: hypothetical protein ACF8R7_02665 [Phycisphaerales bacterium JB039]